MSPRPKNIRKVNDMPVAAGFKPIGLNGCCKNTIFLHFEEYEAIRLCDYEMKTQQEASVSMGVSRPTLSRIYVSARRKIAKALVRGVTIMIEGGAAYTDSEWSVAEHAVSYSTISIPRLKSARWNVRYATPMT